MKHCWDSAIKELLADEGGYVNDPYDPGGETKWGISKRRFPQLDIKNLTKQQAEAIYCQQWWLRYRYDEIVDCELAGELLEASVNIGPSQAHKILQESVIMTGGDNLVADGIIGDKTLFAVNGHWCPGWLVDAFRVELIKYYTSLPGSKRFLGGWVRRAIK